LYYYSSKKKVLENDVTSGYDVTSGHVTDIISGHVTDVTSVHVTSDHVTFGDVISGSTPFHPFLFMNAENLRRKQQISVAYFCSCTGN
jgi:hypothetical protein